MRRSFIIIFRLCILPCLVGFPVFLTTTLVLADESRQQRFFFGGDLGVAYIDVQRSDTGYSGTWLYGALRAEYALYPQLLLGVEGMGWTDQVTASSSISEDVMAFMITARTYPLQNSGAFVKAGWGYAKHRYWESCVSGDASGNGYLVGLGYDVNVYSLSVLYSSGDLDQETYKAWTLSLGFTF